VTSFSWLTAIVGSIPDAVTSTDLDGVVVTWNQAAEDVYGLSAAEAVGSPAADLLPDWADHIRQMLLAVGAGHTVRIDDGELTRRDGTTIAITFTASPIRDDAGVVVGQVSVAADITAHRRAEQRFRQLVKGAPDAMVIVDVEGMIVEVNEQTSRMFGYPAEDLVGRPVEMLVPDRLRAPHVAQRRAFLGRPTVHGMGVGLAISGRRRDGSEFPIEVSLAPLDLGPDKLVSASVRDVTDRQRAERELARARDEAVAGAQLKSQFVAMVSHEIRTPMNGVLGLTDLLLDTPLDLTQRRYVETIGSSGRALLTIINDILDFSKMESGKVELVCAELDLRRLVEEVTGVAAELARDKDIVVAGYYPPTLPATVLGDAGRLRQALLNLVGNAVKFTRRGSVHVTASPSPDGSVTFAVADTGIGIAPADLERLLEPFAQGDDQADRRFGGTGLGLTICRNLVELMGGELEIESAPGEGSRFSFTVSLPPAAGAASGPWAGSGAGDGLSGRRLLVADGNPTTLRLIGEHTRAWGMASTVCGDSASALAALRAAVAGGAPFEVAVLDQSMFGADGMSIVDAVAAERGLGVAHVIVLTSGAYLSDLVAKRAGSVAVMARPVRLSDLYDTLVNDVGRPTGPARRTGPVSAATATVLVAEDNEVNQLVAIGTLAALGYRCDIARNGLDAVRLARSGTYAAVLMDCQMPVLDGYAATGEIRRADPPGRRLPIIAMTAGALAEDRDRCLASGMDDFVTKPIDRETLRAVLDRWITPPPTGPAPAPAIPLPHRQGLPALRDTVAGRLALLRDYGPPAPTDLAGRVLAAFRTGVPERLDAMTTALRAGDADALRRYAHDLVGMAGHLGTEDLAALADDLQRAARDGDLSGAGALVTRIHAEYDRVNSALADLN
jgi:PAS domain S-box-containing protein